MNTRPLKRCLYAAILVSTSLLSMTSAQANIIYETFESVSLPPEQYLRITSLPNIAVQTVASNWDVAVSRKQAMDDVFTYWANGDYTVVEGGGADSSQQWLAAFNFTPGDVVFVAPNDSTFESVAINNVSVVDYTVRNGLYAARAFQSGDFLRVRFLGLDANNSPTGLATTWFDLARFTNSLFVRSDWTTVDLAILNANRIAFEIEGSDNHPTFGLNTPSYLAMDNLAISVVPEPSSLFLLGVGLGIGLRCRRKFETEAS